MLPTGGFFIASNIINKKKVVAGKQLKLKHIDKNPWIKVLSFMLWVHPTKNVSSRYFVQ